MFFLDHWLLLAACNPYFFRQNVEVIKIWHFLHFLGGSPFDQKNVNLGLLVVSVLLSRPRMAHILFLVLEMPLGYHIARPTVNKKFPGRIKEQQFKNRSFSLPFCFTFFMFAYFAIFEWKATPCSFGTVSPRPSMTSCRFWPLLLSLGSLDSDPGRFWR